ncbi:AAA family ATPase [Armatimonas sp.]|uniref:AAA family ATPase n=1 Tax=Armatimonas sp. TaxID=1872638 RepID=UPI003750DA35
MRLSTNPLIGRRRELALFTEALRASELPFSLLNVYGPGGVGKTTLLQAFLAHCTREEIPAHFLNVRLIEPTVGSFSQALPSPIIATRRVLILDTIEALSPELDTWLRENYLPQLSLETLVVLSGRSPLSALWRHDMGWSALLMSLPLRNLSHEEARAYLEQRGLTPFWHESALAFTHGHPLALVLVADLYHQRAGSLPQDLSEHPEVAPNVIQALLDNLMQPELGVHARAALEICALLWAATEVNLAQILQDDTADTARLFTWLRSLSFIEAGPRGLVLHEIARECLIADLRWRNPERYELLAGRARTYYIERIWHASDDEQPLLLLDYVFLSHGSQVVRAIFAHNDPQKALAGATGLHGPQDRQALRAMLEHHEGPESAHWLDYWLDVTPEGALLLRAPSPEAETLSGLLYGISLERLSEAQRTEDPAIAAAWQYLEAHAPLRPGERATYFRFWMVQETYQQVSPLQLQLFIEKVRLYRATKNLSFSFFPVADPGAWGGALLYAGLQRLEEADFTVGGKTYAVFGHDWRLVSPTRWLTRLAESEQQLIGNSSLQRQDIPLPLIALSEESFQAAVLLALRVFPQRDALATNPLAQSRLVLPRVNQSASPQERGQVLQARIQEAVATLQATPRRSQLALVLEQTYLHPLGSQEKVAEELGLPSSTYRRYLRAAIVELTQLLWQDETRIFA